jgi:hypothetical protein
MVAVLLASSEPVLAALNTPTAPAAPVRTDDDLTEIVISVPEPRYVSPTRRDSIGRIWAPVMINGKGPFRLVLDTGATHSAIIAAVAAALELPLDKRPPMLLRGVTGTATVPVVDIDSMVVGDLHLQSTYLPLVVDALGGAQGILGTEGLAGMRIRIDFDLDQIAITRSRNLPAPAGFHTLAVQFSLNRLPMVEAKIGGIRATAIIDTGGQVSIGNLALRDAILKHRLKQLPTVDQITGATADVQQGEGYPAPAVELGDLVVRGAHVTFGDMQIFQHWKLTDEPAMMIGMDTLGLLTTLIIDYQRNELQVRLGKGDKAATPRQ